MLPNGILVVLLILVLISPFVSGPIRVRLRNSHSIDPEFEPCEDEFIPRDVWRIIDELEDLGFAVLGQWHHTGHAHARALVILFEHPQTLDVAKVVVTVAGP